MSIMDFIAIDFETANHNFSSACSLGIAKVKNGAIKECSSYLINPKQPFLNTNVLIHGIKESDVKNAPTFDDVIIQLLPEFSHYPLIAHNAAFDREVLRRCSNKYKIELPKITWYCTLELLKTNYVNLKSYSLKEACDYLGITLENHHCSREDACAAAEIMLHLLKDETTSIFTIDQSYSKRPNNTSHMIQASSLHSSHSSKFDMEPDYQESSVTYDEVNEITFSDKTFVITGDIPNYSRNELLQLIESRGGRNVSAISKNVDYLIVGMQNKNLIKDVSSVKSTKILKAEQLREKGAKIKILSDEFFLSQLSKE